MPPPQPSYGAARIRSEPVLPDSDADGLPSKASFSSPHTIVWIVMVREGYATGPSRSWRQGHGSTRRAFGPGPAGGGGRRVDDRPARLRNPGWIRIDPCRGSGSTDFVDSIPRERRVQACPDHRSHPENFRRRVVVEVLDPGRAIPHVARAHVGSAATPSGTSDRAGACIERLMGELTIHGVSAGTHRSDLQISRTGGDVSTTAMAPLLNWGGP